jgi:hypothetical protein
MKWRNGPTINITREELDELDRREYERLRVGEDDVFELRRSRDCIFSDDGLAVLFRIHTSWDKDFGAYVVLDTGDIELACKHHIFGRLSEKNKMRACISEPKYSTLERLLLDITDRTVAIRHKNGDMTDFRRSNLIAFKKGGELPKELLAAMRERHGIRHTSKSLLYGKTWKFVRREVMKRSGGVCERCHKKPAFHVHHRLPVRFFAVPDDANFLQNLMAVCIKCHRKEHREIRKNLPLLDQMLRSWRLKELRTLDSMAI